MMVLQLVDLSEKSPLPEEALRFVSSEKRKRLSHMVREEDKKRGLVGELLIRQAAGRRLEVPLQEVPIRRTRYGKPYIPVQAISMSTSPIPAVLWRWRSGAVP